jgi:hypothetical protein
VETSAVTAGSKAYVLARQEGIPSSFVFDATQVAWVSEIHQNPESCSIQMVVR